MSDFITHLKTLTKADWQKLFDVRAEIDATTIFAVSKSFKPTLYSSNVFPYNSWSPTTLHFFQVVQEIKIIPVFDWTTWRYGKKIIANKKQDYNSLRIETLCKLLTVIIRTDRFVDGYVVHNLVNGTITKIIKALEGKIK